MPKDTDLGQRKVVDLDRGLFLIEYKSAEDRNFPPKVIVSAAPGQQEQIEIITHPDADGETLWQPQTSLVVRVLERTTLNVEVVPSKFNGSRAAAVRIEPVNQGNAPSPADEAGDLDLDQMRVLGHVAGIGDVNVAMNEWIAGPSAPSRIEGLAIQWPQQPPGLDIRYSVKTGAGQGPASKMVGIGEFAGSRGRAQPVTGLIFEISGNLSRDYILAADAIFLSSPTMRVTGKRIVMSGPTGREPLVGLRLTIEPAEEMPVEPPSERQSRHPVSVPPAARASTSGRVRVFRSRAKQTGN
jgi:hypothetical protein